MPTFFRRLRARLKYWNFERDLSLEIDVHRELAAEEFTRAGFTAREARWAAFRQLGNTTLAREDSRAMWIPRYIQQLGQDARYALRGMRRDWGFAVATVIMLGLGIGLAAGALGFVNAMFLRGWPVPDSRDVFVVEAVFPPSAGRVTDGMSLAGYRHVATNARTADYVAFGGVFVRVSAAKDERFWGRSVPRGLFVSENFFQALRIPLLMGSAPLPRTEASLPTVVLSYKAWQMFFGGDPAIVGRTVWLDGQATIAVGVTTKDFDGLGMDYSVYAPLWASVPLNGRGSVRDAVADEHACCLTVAARTKPGTTREANAAELNTLVSQYRQSIGASALSLQLPDTTSGDGLMRRGNLAATFALVGSGALALLMLTCANVGNLHLARSLRRRHEIVTRLALGAGRGRIVRQLLTEGFVLASIAGALAFAAAVSVPKLMALSGEEIPSSVFGVDWRVGVGTAAVVVIVSLLVSLAPALRATKIAWRGGAAMATAPASGLRGLLLAVQITIATVLILSAVLIARGIRHGVSAPPDFARDTTVAATIQWPRDARPNDAEMKIFRANLTAAVAAGAEPVGLATQMPVSSGAGANTGVSVPDTRVSFSAQAFPMDKAAAEILKLRLTAGRWASQDAGTNEAVINETLAGLVWPNESAVGRALRLDFDKRTYTIAGVVADNHILAAGAIPAIIHIAPIGGTPVLLTTDSPQAMGAVKAMLKTVAPKANVEFTRLSDSVRGTVASAMGGAVIAGGLGLVALLLAMIGVYGVFSYLVEERRREIGIRVALGANRRQVRMAIFRITRWAIGGGVGVGLALSVLAGVALRRFLFGMSPADPVSYVVVSLILTVTALVATYVPIRRALRVSAAVTLKSD